MSFDWGEYDEWKDDAPRTHAQALDALGFEPRSSPIRPPSTPLPYDPADDPWIELPEGRPRVR